MSEKAKLKTLLLPMARHDRMIACDLMAVACLAGARGYDCYPVIGQYPISNARNRAVEVFLAGKYDVAFFVDADTIPDDPIQATIQLERIVQDHAIAHSAYVFRITPEAPLVWTTGRMRDGIVGWSDSAFSPPIQFPDVCATGYTMFRRDVFEHPDVPFDVARKMWFYEKFDDEYGGPSEGDDVMFTYRATQAGFKIGVAAATCKHLKPQFLDGEVKPLRWAGPPGPSVTP